MSDMKQELAETITAISVHNGVARLFFAGIDIDEITAAGSSNAPLKTKPVLCTAMPLSGFLFAATVFEQFLRQDGIQAIIRNMKNSGVAPDALDLSVLLREDNAPEGGIGKTKKSKETKEVEDAELVDAAE